MPKFHGVKSDVRPLAAKLLRVCSQLGKALIAVCSILAIAVLIAWPVSCSHSIKIQSGQIILLTDDNASLTIYSATVHGGRLWLRQATWNDSQVKLSPAIGTSIQIRRRVPEPFLGSTNGLIRGKLGKHQTWAIGGFAFTSFESSSLTGEFGWNVVVPCWFLLMSLLLGPVLWTFRLHKWHTRRRREREGMCVRCGYNLSASSDRCPECGEPITPVSSIFRKQE